MVPLEFASSTENDSRRLWRSCGGSLERLSFWDRVFEKRRRGSRAVCGVEMASYLLGDDSLCVVGDRGGSVCARVWYGPDLDGLETVSSSSSSSDTV
jgi:hypothetical protein